MKKLLLRGVVILVALAGVLALLLITSHKKALRVEREALTPCLSSAMHYDRIERLSALDPWTSLFPHWTITHSERPTQMHYETPSITVDIFGRVVDWRSKEVLMMLVEKGYKDDY
ncbi:hypothetical protein [Haloferula rosea]|uniref:Uncharacterized protein n=1 Tax=Haloferula rosea TaxID=490093 RepID=A0A934RIS3_9BACT|nr:hypothetical protein [Haloferula rosea]MBK1829035.1 hypothetical protein [Haloferula rosea]